MVEKFLKVEKEKIRVEMTIPDQILIGFFNKDKGIRLTDYFNRDQTKQGFVVLYDVSILDVKSRQEIEKKKFLAVNVDYIITATEIHEEKSE